MAAAGRTVPIYVLDGTVDTEKLTGEPGQDWARIKCDSKKAYGCGELGQQVLEGLTLYVRIGDDPVVTSSLALRMTHKALRSIEEAIGFKVDASVDIQIAHQHLMVIHLELRSDLKYHLVYDVINASLSLIKYLPDHYKEICAYSPLPVRTADGGDYDLLFVALELGRSSWGEGVLCVCTPETRENPGPDGICPWQIKAGRLPAVVQGYFSTDMLFSFNGKAFWADLAHGLMYRDLRHTSGDSAAAVDFRFIKLPDYSEETDRTEAMKLTRTVGCVGESIWYVRINRSTKGISDDLVKIWSLKLDDRPWTLEHEFSAKMLWKQADFKKNGLPKLALEYPTLMEDGAICFVLPGDLECNEDGAICFVLPDQLECNEDNGREDRICCIDVPNRKLLWHGRVRDYQFTSPVVLPSGFFQTQHLPCKRKLAEHDVAAGLTEMID